MLEHLRHSFSLLFSFRSMHDSSLIDPESEASELKQKFSVYQQSVPSLARTKTFRGQGVLANVILTTGRFSDRY